MAQTIFINGMVRWVYSQTKGGTWLAICEDLKLTMEGDTYQEMLENLSEGIQLLLVDLVKTGDFDRFLREKGWHKAPAHIPANVTLRTVRFDIPMEIVASKKKTQHSFARTTA